MVRKAVIIRAVTGWLFVMSMTSCIGFQGHVYQREENGDIGPIIAGSEIVFQKENSAVTRTATSNASGFYRRRLDQGRYVVTASHIGHQDYSSAPGFFVVTGNSLQTGNIFLHKVEGTTVVLVRHAEREDNSANTNLDPDQNNQGLGVNRASQLGAIAANANVAAVYVTEFCRTAQTGQPAAITLNTPLHVQRSNSPSAGINSCDPPITAQVDLLPSSVNSSSALANRVLTQHAGDVILIVGHSNTVPEITEALGAASLCPAFFAPQVGGSCHIPSDEFDNLFVVTIPLGPGAASVTRQKY